MAAFLFFIAFEFDTFGYGLACTQYNNALSAVDSKQQGSGFSL
jgi:hypothetical protein